MKIIRNAGLFTIMIAMIVSCNKVTYRKSKGGMPYKVFPGNGKQKLVAGNIVKYDVRFVVKSGAKDTVYFDSYNKLPVYAPVTDIPSQSYDVSEIWQRLAVGDSVITTQMIDTFLLRNPAMGASGKFKKGDKLISYIKVLAAIPNDSLRVADEMNERNSYLASEVKFMENYLAQKKINTVKTPSGAFVEIINPGTGNPIDSGNYVSVNYTGTTIAGKKFDSNTDSAFHHLGPISFTIGTHGMIQGFEEGIKLLKPGGSARVYVPSMLGYGPSPDPASGIKPYEHIYFDVSVVNVQKEAPNTGVPNINQPRPR
jgi:FKBP-type peptidyl-prolyl cis-trans isomerase FkpA